MPRLIFDIETDGLLNELSVIHSLVIKDVDTGEVTSCARDRNGEEPGGEYFNIVFGLKMLGDAPELIGHNILKFDLPAIQKVYPWFKVAGKITDTLTLSRLIWPDMKERDFRRRANLQRRYGYDKMQVLSPGKLIGSHGLESWGLRMGEWKGDYSKEKEAELKALTLTEHTADREAGMTTKEARPKLPSKQRKNVFVWGSWSPSMQRYCEQDVEVTHAFLRLIEKQGYHSRAVNLEEAFVEIIWQMECEGFPFNKHKAEKLERKLMVRKAVLEQELQVFFPPWEVRTPFTPKVNSTKRGYKKGVPTTKVKIVVFNPGSRDHIANRLMTLHGWKPTEYTNELIPGTSNLKPVINETILKQMEWPEAALLKEYLTIQKRLGMLSDGVNAWLKMVKTDGRIYHSVITNGAVTGRCTHSRPNLGQVPTVGSDYGAECRALFGPPKGMLQVGADLSGLELRCLAHYMARYDDGAYVKELLEGDIHSANQEAAGLPTRAMAKTFIYAFLYGAGNAKIGSIVGGSAAAGKKLKERFLAKTPALAKLQEAIAAKTKFWIKRGVENPYYKGYLIGLDRRRLPIRHEHAALNTLLQSAGAVISKEATVLLYHDLTTSGYTFGVDWALMAHVHDEVQMWAKPALAETVGKAAVRAFEQAGVNFNFHCPITGEFKIGENWFDCH